MGQVLLRNKRTKLTKNVVPEWTHSQENSYKATGGQRSKQLHSAEKKRQEKTLRQHDGRQDNQNKTESLSTASHIPGWHC